MSMSYKDLIINYPEYFVPSNDVKVYVPVYCGVTLLRTYTGISLYLEGKRAPDGHRVDTTTVNANYYHMFHMGNRGFKQTYIKVYNDYRKHAEYGTYVGWVVHL